MAYDAELADRIRDLLGDERDVIEKKMFGGLAFLIGGNMAVAANRAGGLMVRIDPDDVDELTSAPNVERMVMGGRTMNGWLRVDLSGEDATAAEARDLADWVRRGVEYAASLPPK